MTGFFNRRTTLAGLVSLAGTAGLAGPLAQSLRPVARPGSTQPVPPSMHEPIAGLIQQAGVSGTVGCAIAEVGGAALAEDFHGAVGLPPASVAKVPTTLYALHALAPDYRFVTRLFATGQVNDAILDGDLILAGGGDPTLTTDDLALMARDLAAKGLRRVTGKFLVWGGALPYVHEIDPGQMPHLGYNPAVSGLNLNSNRVHFEWVQNGEGYKVTLDARSRRYHPEVHMAQMQIVARDLPVYTYGDAGGIDNWTVAQGALGQGGARWLPVRDPARYAGDVFRSLAGGMGIGLPQAEVATNAPRGTPFVSHQSEPLTVILRDMLDYSTNITAEAVGLTATTANSGAPRGLRASARSLSAWLLREYGVAARLVDHSGLGDASRISAAGLVRLLARPESEALLAPLLEPIPIRDSEGRPIADHSVRVVAKTGTLNFVSTLAGYVTTADGRRMAFAIMAADLDQRAVAKTSDEEVPRGARTWNARARRLQQALLLRWGVA